MLHGKSRVAALKVTPDSILPDIERLCDLAGLRRTLDAGAITILKDNLSWHFPAPGANTTPWQLSREKIVPVQPRSLDYTESWLMLEGANVAVIAKCEIPSGDPPRIESDMWFLPPESCIACLPWSTRR